MTAANNANTIFICGKSRGIGVLQNLKGESKAIGISDNYGAYRSIFENHQLCWVHLHRKFKDLAYSKTLEEGTRIHCEKIYKEFSKIYLELRETLLEEYNQKLGIIYKKGGFFLPNFTTNF